MHLRIGTRRSPLAMAQTNHVMGLIKAKFPQANADPAALAAAAAADPAAADRGKVIFSANCAACHGDKGQGAIGPSFQDAVWLYGGKPAEIVHTITNGTAKGMPPFKTALGAGQLADVAAYVHALGKK